MHETFHQQCDPQVNPTNTEMHELHDTSPQNAHPNTNQQDNTNTKTRELHETFHQNDSLKLDTATSVVFLDSLKFPCATAGGVEIILFFNCPLRCVLLEVQPFFNKNALARKNGTTSCDRGAKPPVLV